MAPKTAARTANQDASNRSHWSVMADAICSALPIPLIFPRVSMLEANPCVSAINNLIKLTASSEPKAVFRASDSATSNVSPNFPFNLSRMSSIGSIFPWASTNDRFNLSCAPPTPAKNDLYFVPASLPLMVDCKVPRIAICSDIAIPADVALAPTLVKALLISLPVVLNICTALAVMPATSATHSPLPISSAWFLKIPYMVPM